jgi:3-deoxy-D-manno-octulosonic-acid transferase
VVARVAPLDMPQLLRSFLRAAAPWRLDVIETELWPHLILESRRRGVAVVFVSAAVSERTRARLLRWGLAGRSVFGEGVWVLAQSERHAERFRSLGVPSDRIAVTGDLKAERPTQGASRGVAERPAVVFGSLRPGEEEIAAALARGLASLGDRALVVAPRHREGLALTLAALEREGIPVAELGTGVGVLATQGELPAAYPSAAVAIVGGTFAAYGGHNALEPAARGCAVVVGPHVGAIEESVEALARESAVLRAANAAEGLSAVLALLRDPGAVRRMGEGAVRAAVLASDSARRSLQAIERFGLTP